MSEPEVGKNNMKSIRQQAEDEIRTERRKYAKETLKKKLLQLADAEQIVENLKRELDELEHELANGIG